MMARCPYSQCLSRASLSDSHHVPAAQGQREALRLDRCGLLKVLLHQHIHHILYQKKQEVNQGHSHTALLLAMTSAA